MTRAVPALHAHHLQADGESFPQADLAAGASVAAQAWLSLLQALPHAAWLADLRSRQVVAVNESACKLYGRTAQHLVSQHSDALLASPEDAAWWAEVQEGLLGGSAPSHISPLCSDTVVALTCGRALHATRSMRALAQAEGGAPSHVLVMLVDRSAEHRAQTEREELLAELQATLEATADGILVTDLHGRIRASNQRFAALWELPQELLQQRKDAAVQDWVCRRMAGDAATRKELKLRWNRLHEHPEQTASSRFELLGGGVLECLTRPLYNRGVVQGRVWSFRDLTEQLAARQQIETLSRQDALTGLPNRRVLAEQVVERLRHRGGRNGTDAGFALLVVDLDHFAQVNDGMGQAVGDQVLREVAQRITATLRQQDQLARLGGDQFAVLVQTPHAEGAEASARRVLRVVGEPFQWHGETFTLTCSVGVALAPTQGQTLDELLRHAQAAVRTAKQHGRANYRLYQSRSEVDRQSHMALDHAMRQALVSGRFRLNYQPQVSLEDGHVLGAEALLRWRDPEMGEIPPGRFIPVAEASGFIVAIGDWVLSQAVRQAVLWHHAGYSMPIAVNVSALQFQQPHFVERVANVLAVSGLPPQLLELELTESILVLDADDALRRLEALAQLGLKLSIDDFGTGYSSLSYLKRFPIGKLKIDRSFVKGLPHDEGDAAIVRAILQMARALRLKVVAEGVETEAQRDFLRDHGCDEFQGFLFAPALDALSFEQRLKNPGPPLLLPPNTAQRIRLVQG